MGISPFLSYIIHYFYTNFRPYILCLRKNFPEKRNKLQNKPIKTHIHHFFIETHREKQEKSAKYVENYV
ncbi:unknown [Bacteroides sp. CAG:714]|nr:unknown [Bacteroides sp. CAG:714]